MAFYKVIASGGVIEVYEYEKDTMKEIHGKNNDKYNQYEKIVLENDENDWLHEKTDRTDERRKQTMRDARNLTRRLALMNFGQGDTFITLTYAENMQDIEKADNDFKKFIQRFRYRYKGLKYIAVREFQKRGAIHFHMICNWNEDLESEEQIKEKERWFGEKLWGHGFVDIKVLDGVDNVGAYLIKYMTKNISIEAFKGKKAYLCSKGLERPLVYRGDEAKRIVELYELDTKKEVFTNSYESEYLGQITYKEYNLERL
jgi:hypothetical protein